MSGDVVGVRLVVDVEVASLPLVKSFLERNERKVDDIEKMIYVSKVCQKKKYYRAK